MSENMVATLVNQREQAEALVAQFRERVVEAQRIVDRVQVTLDEAKECERRAVSNLMEAQEILVTTMDEIRCVLNGY